MGLLVDKDTRTSFIQWTNDVSKDGNFDVTFEFGSIRGFTLAEIYFSQVYSDIALVRKDFFEIATLVSLDGKQFLEVSRNKNFTAQDGYVHIDMHKSVGKFAKVQLNLLKSRLVRVSEIYFETTALNISSEQIENIQRYLVIPTYHCNNACFFGLIGGIAVLGSAILGLVIWLIIIKLKIKGNNTRSFLENYPLNIRGRSASFEYVSPHHEEHKL